MRGRTKQPSGHRRLAVMLGMAECTPNLRASELAAQTTPRWVGGAPTITGWPRNAGLSRCSTDA